MIKKCHICKKEFNLPPSKCKEYAGRPANKHFFCSRDCYKKFWLETVSKKKETHWHWKGGNVKTICEYCKKEFETRRKGKDRKYKFCSMKCWGHSIKGKYAKEKNPNWKGSPRNDSRTHSNYLEWRKKIIKRDAKRCKDCGLDNNLQAHHLKSYTHFPEISLDLNNGITLCRDCHKKRHRFLAR